MDTEVKEGIDDEEGYFAHEISKQKLFAETPGRVQYLNRKSPNGEVEHRLYQTADARLKFDRLEAEGDVFSCDTEIAELPESNSYSVTIVWKPDQLKMGVKSEDMDQMKRDVCDEPVGRTRRDDNGNLVRIGDSGVEVGDYQVHVDGERVLKPTAIEMAEFNFKKADHLLRAADSEEFLIETTIVQQMIGLMVTVIETYLKEKYVELSRENLSEQETINSLLQIYPGDEKKLRKVGKKRGLDPAEFATMREMNFQDISNAHKVYNSGLGFNLQQFLNSNGFRPAIEKNINRRHEIIHEGPDKAMLETSGPDGTPVFADKEYGENLVSEFSECISRLEQKLEAQDFS
ncbi:hypothetical protein [Haloferax chudinovii]|uniref:RiboL-PSP-HEPN domain-containing protein n=1 Tax=Haloferax chudinovii TaxID=1109010 RepID=A0ABD5XL10_9EURY